MFGRLKALRAAFDRLRLSGPWFKPKPAQAEPVEAHRPTWQLAMLPLTLLTLGTVEPATRPAASADIAAACGTRDGWSEPAPPAHIFDKSWFVGTCGITVVLIETRAGLVLIDSGPLEAVPHVLANVRALGFDPKEIKWLLVTHEHFDHVGGIAAIQRETGARLAVGPFIADAIRSGRASADDPQAAWLEKYPMAPARVDQVLRDRGKFEFGGVYITAHATPTHTSGSTSWVWHGCAGRVCRTIALADSANAISADGYRFTDHPKRVASARYGLDRIAALPCDILITPHPSSSNLFERLSGKAPLSDRRACRLYAEAGRERLNQRLAKENSAK